MLASQLGFSYLGIPYPQVGNGEKPQQVYNDTMGVILMSYKAIGDGTYHSPTGLPAPTDIPGLELQPGQTMAEAIAALIGDPLGTNEFTKPLTDFRAAKWTEYLATCTTGNLKAVHTAVDALNAVLVNFFPNSQPVFVPRSDLDILRTTAGIIGIVSQQCGPNGGQYFPYGTDPVTDRIIQQILTGTGPASMQPTVFFAS